MQLEDRENLLVAREAAIESRERALDLAICTLKENVKRERADIDFKLRQADRLVFSFWCYLNKAIAWTSSDIQKVLTLDDYALLIQDLMIMENKKKGGKL